MRKIIKFLLSLIKIVILLAILGFVYHRYMLKKEDDLFKPIGQIVEVNNHDISVLVEGPKDSSVTLVFMSGAGTASPILDFKTLDTLFKENYQIAVVEKVGYGFSDTDKSSRDIEVMLLETRMALEKAGIENKNYILVPHSASAIEALYWANKYPEEVKGIIGLDPALPDAYENMKKNNLLYTAIHYASYIGIARYIPGYADSITAIKEGNLTDEEIKLYKIISYRRTMTAPMLEETKTIFENAKKLKAIDDTNVPMLLFASNGEGTGFEKDAWQKYITDYAQKKENRMYVSLDCSHYMHNIEYRKIYDESKAFIDSIINKN